MATGMDDALRMAAIRLWDLAAFSRRKADELGNSALNDDAAMHERDAVHFSSLRAGG